MPIDFFLQVRNVVSYCSFYLSYVLILVVNPLNKKVSKFGALLEDVIDELEGNISYIGDEFTNFI